MSKTVRNAKEARERRTRFGASQLREVLEGITTVCHYSPWKLFHGLSEGVIKELEERGFKVKQCVNDPDWHYVSWD